MAWNEDVLIHSLRSQDQTPDIHHVLANASDDNLVDGVTHKERGRPTITSPSRTGTFNARLGGKAIPAHAEHQYLPISSTV
ncbi:hypothetical protein BKA70DRAFT_1439429 [Coprinopsis sp. MPI-PUGE-AT-0042]|nr:hypothetical protein BKA70DRAFT_1439429 [Coprinopsis sp. MPI-PUGE-AT-0042]